MADKDPHLHGKIDALLEASTQDCSVHQGPAPCENPDDEGACCCYQRTYDPCATALLEQILLALNGECETGMGSNGCCVNGIDLSIDPDTGDLVVSVTNTNDETFTDSIPLAADCDFSGLPDAACADVDGLVTADCEVVDACAIMPAHAIGQCCLEGETFTPAAGSNVEVITDLAATELARGQVGTRVINPTPSATRPNIPPNTFPLTIPIPASNPDCTLALHVTFGGSGPEGTLDGPTVVNGAGADYSAPVFVNENGVNASNGVPGYRNGTALWLFDPVTGAAGSDVILDFTTKITDTAGDPQVGDIQGVVQWYWVELCDAAGAVPLDPGDFDIAGLQTAEVGAYTAENTPTAASSAIDLGDCAGFYYGAARHVDQSGPGPADGLNVDSDWANPNNPAIIETYDTTSHQNDGSCQMGSTFGIVPGGTGPWTYSATPNGSSAVPVLTPPNSGLTALSLASCDEGPGGGDPEETATCDVPVTNPNCKQSAVLRCSIRGAVTICVEPGDHLKATPKIGGVLISDQVVAIDNTNGTSSFCQTIPVSSTVTDMANIIPPGGSASSQFSWEVEAVANGGNGTVEISDWEAECEIVHI